MLKNIFISVTVLIFLTSCDLLNTRTPEEPKTSSSNFVPAYTAEILFQNFKSSIEEKITENYISCFVDSSYLDKKYIFIQSGSDQRLNDWGLESEQRYFTNLKAKLQQGSSISLTVNNIQSVPFGQDSAFYSFDYNLIVNSTDQELSNQYQGAAQFKIYKDSREQWVIVEWRDIKKDDFLTWSDLKGKTY